MVLGTGMDVVRIDRVARLLERSSRRFEQRVFTAVEVARCRENAWPARGFAQCFALKEAVLKAAGTGMTQGANWHDIEAEFPAEGEAPVLRISGRVGEAVRSCGADRWLATVGIDRRFAVALVVLEGQQH